MKKVVSVTALTAGLLLVLVPRFILPVCEYEGYARMHCSDTAAAEYVIGALLMVAGVLAALLKRPWLQMANTAAAVALLAAAWFMPAVYGYCASRKMPCHYGAVPGIRFIAVIAGIVLLTALAVQVRSRMRLRKRP